MHLRPKVRQMGDMQAWNEATFETLQNKNPPTRNTCVAILAKQFSLLASCKEIAGGEDLQLSGLDEVDRSFVEQGGHLVTPGGGRVRTHTQTICRVIRTCKNLTDFLPSFSRWTTQRWFRGSGNSTADDKCTTHILGVQKRQKYLIM